MSLVKTNAVQLGQSGTPTQNFTWYQPAVPDSTVRLGNGNSGSVTDILTVNSTSNVGLGVNPSAWTTLRGFQLGNGAAISGNTANGNAYMSANGYYNGSWTYLANGYLMYTRLSVADGVFSWLTAPSGLAGATAAPSTLMQLDASGNLGLGVTPSAWNTGGYKAIDIGTTASVYYDPGTTAAVLSNNSFINSSYAYTYKTSTYATRYQQDSGKHIWYNAPSGSAGAAITFTQAMTLDASGNLGIGTSSPTSFANYKFVTTQATTGAIYQAFGASSTDSRVFADNGYGGTGMFSNHPFVLYTNSTERMRIDTSGNVAIGTSSSSYRLRSYVDNGSTAGIVYPIVVDGTSSAAGNTNGSALGFIFGTRALASVESVRTNPGGDYGSSLVFKTNNTGEAAGTLAALTEKFRINTDGYATGTVAANSAGIMPAKQFYRLNTTLAGANATGAQKVLGVGVSLAANTQYVFEGSFYLTKAAGTTSHNVTFNFGGTAGVNNMECEFLYNVNATSLATTGATSRGVTASFAAAITVASAIVTAVEAVVVTVKGTISVSTAGTMIPQYNLSAAPGGAYTTAIGSYFSIWPVAASGANVNIGSWA